MIAQFLFWFCTLLLVYSYLLYPFLLSTLYKLKGSKESSKNYDVGKVYIMMAAHNEELVITQKLDSIENNNIPTEKISIYIGSDNSTDKTNQIVEDYKKRSKYNVDFSVIQQRAGKIGIINILYQNICSQNEISDKDVFILTDADVLFRENTIQNLVRHYADANIGIVDTKILSILDKDKEVAKSETTYLNREFQLKYFEGELFGKLMGTFGGCFAIRANCFKPIPNNFRVDDFYLTMHTLSKGYKAISDPEAICEENVVSTFSEEFKRKRRISGGNFQNMSVYRKYLLPFSSLGFVFFSHKVIRYVGCILMLIAFFSCLYLAVRGSYVMQIIFMVQLFWYFIIPLFDRIAAKFGHNILALRGISYFNYMNLALLLGLKDYLYGIESNIWEPTKRK